MSCARHIIFSFLCIFNTSLSMEPNKQEQQRRRIRIQPYYTPEILEHSQEKAKEKKHHHRFQPLSHFIEFDQDDIKEMEQVFNYSPIQARNIVKYLSNPAYLFN